MIQVNNLIKYYNKNKVIDIDCFGAGDSELVGIAGNNGAGKTTFFRLLLDLIKSDGGEVLIKNQSVVRNEIWKQFTGAYLDESFLIDYLTPEEFFSFVGGLCNISTEEISHRLKSFDHFFANEILNKKGKFIRDYSKGNKQKIGIASVFITEPSLLLFDEPFEGLDPTSQILLKQLLIEYNRKKESCILISSHDLNHITDICSRIVVVEGGRIVKEIRQMDQALDDLQNYFQHDLKSDLK